MIQYLNQVGEILNLSRYQYPWARFFCCVTPVAAVLFCFFLFVSNHVFCCQVYAADPSASDERVMNSISGSRNIALGIGVRDFVDDDLDATYGYLPVISLRSTRVDISHVRYYYGIGLVFGKGNPYYDLPDFNTDLRSRMLIVPAELGIGIEQIHTRRFHLYWGVALQAFWFEEKYPSSSATGSSRDSWRGGYMGVSLPIGIEWLFTDKRRVLGCEFSFNSDVRKISTDRYNYNEINPRGTDLKIYCSIRR